MRRLETNVQPKSPGTNGAREDARLRVAIAHEYYLSWVGPDGRFTLWTGDPGTALYLADCLAGRGALPLP